MASYRGCPHALCRVGLWYIVAKGCIGTIRYDPQNGDRKVWFVECRNCSQRKGTVPEGKETD